MRLLVILGLASIAFVALHTWWAAAKAQHTTGQSPRASIVEAWVNILIGFSINFAMNIPMIPLIADHQSSAPPISWWNYFWGGWVFTVVSIIRQYAIRRWFNARIHLFAARAAEKLA